MAGPPGTTGTTQANPDTLNNGTPVNTGVVSGGFVTGSGVLSTPTGMFAAPAPTAGISDAGRAGISSASPVNAGVESSMEPSTMVLTNVPPVNPSGVNPTAVAASGRMINDMGPSFYSDVIERPNTGVSLAEIAMHYKQARTGVNARMLTNDDVQKMVDNRTGVTTAANMPPLGPGGAAPSAAAQRSTSPSQPQNAPAPSQTAQGGTQAGQPTQAQPQTETAPSSSAAQGSATAGASTTPQINPNQQSNDTQGKSKLPATATFLPLLGLLGLVSGGIGLLVRKFRK